MWRVAVLGDRLATAGADASIKLWSLREAAWHNGSGRADGERGDAAEGSRDGGLQTLAWCPSPNDAGDPSKGALLVQSLMRWWQPQHSMTMSLYLCIQK